uniref:Ig-like domain-containing protein n=1 Tax=Oryzias latipes TaxID=8090 RepID=A0A3P9JZE5_ORYLA
MRVFLLLLFVCSLLNCFFILFRLVSGTDGSDVSQTSMLWTKKGQDATMNCSHTKDATFYQMYWYRQLPGETMEQVVFTSTAQRGGEHDFGAFSKEKFSATKTEAERGTFTVKEVQPEDKGLYFCAVSQHSDTNP